MTASQPQCASPRATALVSLALSVLIAVGVHLTSASMVDGKFLYKPASVPFHAEIFKFVLSAGLAGLTSASKDLRSISLPALCRYAPPAILFWISNNTAILSYQYLDPATIQVLSTLRTTFTALFMSLIRLRRFSRLQWVSIVFLTVAAAMSQVGALSVESATPSHKLTGYILAVLSAAASSGSVAYTELVLKSSQCSMHLQNAQLYFWGIMVNVCVFLSLDRTGHYIINLSQGYTAITWVCVGHLSSCGIVVSWLLKYSDAIAKAYATSGAMFLSSAYSIIALGVALPTRLLAAMILASFSLLMFYGGIRVSFGGKIRCVENIRTNKSLQMLRGCNQEQV